MPIPHHCTYVPCYLMHALLCLGNEGEGNHEDRSVRDTQMKLFLLERKLKEQRQFMEDNPGDVTCESEELISALEEEVKSMRTDFTAASGPKSNGRTGPRGLGGWRDDRDKCRISQKQEQEHEHALGLSQGEDEVKEMSRDKFSPRGITDSETSFRSPQPPTQPSGGVVRDGTTPVSRKDMTQGRLNHNINQQKKGSSYVPALRDKALRSGSDTHDEHTDGDLIPEDGRDLPIRDKDCPTASPLSPDAKTAEDIDESSHGYDDDAYEDEDDFIAPEHEHKVDPKDDISVLTSTDAGSKALSANPRGAETSNILNGFKKNLKGDFSDQSITPSNPITSIPVSASTSTSQAYPLVSQPVHAPPVPRPATKGPPSLAEIRRLKEEKLLQQEKEDKEKADSAPPVTLPVHVPVSTYKDSEAQGGSTSDSYSLPGKADNGTKNQSYKIPQIQAEESGGYVPSTQARVKRSDVSKEKEKEIEKEIFYVKETKKDKEKEREKEKEKDTDEMYCAVKVKEKDKKTDYNEDDDDDDDMYINVKNKKENGDKPSWNVKEKVIVKEKDKEKEVEKEKEKKTDNWNKNVKSSWDTEKVVEGKSKVEEKEKEVDLKYVTQTPKGGQFQGGNYEEKVPLQVKKPGTFSQYGNSKRVGDDYDDAYEFNGSDDEIA